MPQSVELCRYPPEEYRCAFHRDMVVFLARPYHCPAPLCIYPLHESILYFEVFYFIFTRNLTYSIAITTLECVYS